MNRKYALALAAIAMVGWAAQAGEAADDLKKLQGTWKVVKGVRGGQEAPKAVLDSTRFVFKDDMMTFKGAANDSVAATIKLNSAAKPRELDMTAQDGPRKGETRKAIYELEGDTLKFCVARQGDRPKEFASKAGEQTMYLELKRAKE